MKRPTIRNSIKYTTIIFAILLVLAVSSSFISPITNGILPFMGLAYLPILLVNIVFLLFWIVKKKWFGLVPLIVLLLTSPYFNTYFSLNILSKNSSKNKIKVLSYNVRLFDYYKWIQKDTSMASRIMSLFEMEHPDILCVQEFQQKKPSAIKSLDTIYFSHLVLSNLLEKEIPIGIATFSKYPIINKGQIKLNNRTSMAIYSDITIGRDTVRVYNLYLQSINRIKKTELYLRLYTAFKKRSIQAEIISKHIRSSPYPTILCGDMNDTSISYTYNKIKGKMEDAFCQAGNGFGTTYMYNIYPFRIDYILHDPKLISSNFKILKLNLSDHYPIKCDISFK